MTTRGLPYPYTALILTEHHNVCAGIRYDHQVFGLIGTFQGQVTSVDMKSKSVVEYVNEVQVKASSL